MATSTDRILVLVEAVTKGAVGEMGKLEKSTKDTQTAYEKLGGALKKGILAGGAVAAGAGIFSFLSESVGKFQAAQDAAAKWAQATNTSVQQAGKFTTLMRGFGLEMDDLVEISAEFNSKIEAQPQLLSDLNVEISKNADGTANMTETMADAITALGDMEDGTEQARIGFQLFGEEGYKQLTAIVLAGGDVEEMMKKIDFTDNSEQARDFAAATAEMSVAMEELQIRVGGAIVPILTGVADALSAIMDVAEEIPGSIYLVVAGAVALKVAMGSTGVQRAIGIAAEAMLDFKTKVAESGGAMGAFKENAGKLGAVAGTAAKTTGVMLLLSAAIEAVANAFTASERTFETFMKTENANKNLLELSQTLRETDGVIDSIMSWELTDLLPDSWFQDIKEMKRVEENLKGQAQATLDAADANKIQKKAAEDLMRVIEEGNLQTDEGTAAMDAYRDAMGGAAKMSEDLGKKQQTLDDLIADIVKHGAGAAATQQDIADAAAAAAAAQREQEAATRLTNIAMYPYMTQAEKAAFWQDELTRSIEDGVTSGGQFEAVARNTADAMARQESETRLAEQALDDFNYTYSQLIEDLANTEVWGGGVENLKASLEGLDFKDAPETWANEWKIASEDARSSILAEMGRIAEFDPNFDPQKFLEDLKVGAPAEVVKIIEGIQQEIKDHPLTVPGEIQMSVVVGGVTLTGTEEELRRAIGDKYIAGEIDARTAIELQTQLTGLNVPVTVETTNTVTTNYTPSMSQIEANKAAIATPVSSTWTLNAVYNPSYNDMVMRLDVLKSVDGMTPDITYWAHFEPGGYEAIKSRLDFILDADGKTPDIAVWTHMNPDYETTKRQLDSILAVDGKTPDINVYTHFNPGYDTVRSQLAELTRNRTVNIDINTRGLAAAEAAIRATASPQTAAAAVQRIIMPEQQQPVNIVKVNVAGSELRATIRDELLNVRRSDDLAAAMGTVA